MGTPTWRSGATLSGSARRPSVVAAGLAIGSSFTAGLVLGYLWYCTVHYGAHHWHAGQRRGYFYKMKRRHAIHHQTATGGNFGVTTSMWDHVFRTCKR